MTSPEIGTARSQPGDPGGAAAGRQQRRSPQAVAIVTATVFGAWWGAPIVSRMINDVDFPFHLKAAADFVETGWITMPHFLLQVLLGASYATGLFGSLERAGVAFFGALYAAAAAATCWYLVRRPSGWLAAATAVVLTAGVLIAAPILPEGEDDLFLIGYFPPNVYHNPTMLVAKPLLVLTFAAGVAALCRHGSARVRELIALVLPAMLLGFAKPNYLGCLAPAIVLAGGWASWHERQPVSFVRVGAVAGACVLTVAATLLLYRLLAIGEGARVVFAPLAVIGHYADVDARTIARSLYASLAFPLAVSVMWPRAAWRDPAMRLAWLGTAAGLFFSYFLAEAGTRMYDGNFLWTGQMAVFVMFVAAAALLTAQVGAAGSSGPFSLARHGALLVRMAIAAAILWQHVASGVRYVRIKVPASAWTSFLP